MQASHILVDSLQKAEAILAEATPQSFSSLAKQHSSCPSKAQGGNLERLVPVQWLSRLRKQHCVQLLVQLASQFKHNLDSI